MIPEPLKLLLRGHMRKFFVTLMTSLLSCSTAFAFFPEAAESSIEIGVGYRSDSLSWETSVDTIDFTLGVPANFTSNVKWKKLDIWQIEAKGKFVTCDDIYLRGYVDYGWVTHGHVNATVDEEILLAGFEEVEIFDFSADSNKGHVFDISGGIGYQFRMCDDTFSIAPIVGYSYHSQHLDITGDEDDFTSPVTGFTATSSDVLSTYKARWRGPWLGLDLEYRVCCDWTLYAGYEYHWARYYARGEWGLRSDLPNGFSHHAKRAHGQIFTVGTRWDFCGGWSASVNGTFQWWRAKRGTDRAVLTEFVVGGNDEFEVVEKIPLEHVQWCSAGVSIDVGYLF
jgi:hypothetical protein